MQIVHDILKPRKIDGKELNTDNLKEYLISMETTFATSDASCPNTLAYVSSLKDVCTRADMIF